MAGLCARLPLALRIAADRLNTAGWQLREAVVDLAGEPLLDALAAGDDPHTAAAAVFSWSYRALPAVAATLFRRLGLVPGEDWDAYVAASLANGTVVEARRSLAMLTAQHLIEDRGGRFQMHDLLRAYAAERAATDEPADERRAAVGRLYNYYLGTAAAAMDIAFPHESHRRPQVAKPDTPFPYFADVSAGMAWLDAERANLRAAVTDASHDRFDHAVQLSATLYRYLMNGAHYHDALIIHGHALKAAVAARDHKGESVALAHLGAVNIRLSRHDDAIGHLTRSLKLLRQTGNRVREAGVLGNLGVLYHMTSRYQEAIHHQEQAFAIYREIGDRAGEANTLGNLGDVCQRIGLYQTALEHLQQSLEICHEIGDQAGESNALSNIGIVYRCLGRHSEAIDHHLKALDIVREVGDRANEGQYLNDLGVVYRLCQRFREARDHHRDALTIAQEIGDHCLEVGALNNLGELSRAEGRRAEAREHHERALNLAQAYDDQYERGRALEGVGYVQHDLGELAMARERWAAALDIYTALGVPEAERLRTQLEAKDEGATR